MSEMDQAVFCGYITKKEILIRLAQHGIMSEENLRPIESLRESQFLRLDTVEFYKNLFERSKQEMQEEVELSFAEDDSLELNDTLAEMEAFIMQGTEYALSEVTTPKIKDESTFHPIISSTVTDEISSQYLLNPQNSELSNHEYSILESSSSSILRNISNTNRDNTRKLITNSKLCLPKSFENFHVSDKNGSKTPLKRDFGSEIDLNSPEILFTPKNYALKQNSIKMTPEIIIKGSEEKKRTPNTRENCIPNSTQKTKEIFKTPLPKVKAPNFKNIVSPISRYISETPSVPLLQKVVQKTILTSEHNFKTPINSSKHFASLPEVDYMPSQKQQISFEARTNPLPKCIDKYISKPLRFEIIKHMGRKNVKNEYEEYFESVPFDAQIEDLSQFIDLETTRFGEISVMVSSESKFSSELIK